MPFPLWYTVSNFQKYRQHENGRKIHDSSSLLIFMLPAKNQMLINHLLLSEFLICFYREFTVCARKNWPLNNESLK